MRAPMPPKHSEGAQPARDRDAERHLKTSGRLVLNGLALILKLRTAE